ncbi:MAG: KH domain-containing protein [Ruminococcaceae bacterium]|nr:KH domain-containing protein [Oscillospiraceae bacterium]
MSRLLEDMVRAIVEHPDEVSVSESESAVETVYTLKVAESDMGMVIGKHGNIARAIRTVAKAAARITDKKISVEIR